MEADLPRKAHQYARCTNRKQIQFGNPRTLQLLQIGSKNVSVLNSFYRIMRGSLFKTFGCKYRTTYKHIKVKYVRNGIPLWIVAILGRLGWWSLPLC